MASYNLTDKQKYLLKTIVEHIHAGKLDEPIITSCSLAKCQIMGISEEFERDLLGNLDALCDVNLMRSGFDRKNKVYSVKQAGYDAITNNFVLPEKPASTQLNIGSIINGGMHGGTLQSIGLANDSEIKQIVNDPQLLADEINKLTNQLLEVIKADLSADKLVAYIKQVEELKQEVTSDKPSQPVLQRLFNSLAFMGDIEGTISLAARVWPYVYPILVIAAEKVVAAR